MKSAVFERQRGLISTALDTLSKALAKFPRFAKLYMIQGQIHQSQKDYALARASFAAGLKACPKEPTLWILASKLEEADRKSIKARAPLKKARLIISANDVLWAEAVGVEERSGGGPHRELKRCWRGVCKSVQLLDFFGRCRYGASTYKEIAIGGCSVWQSNAKDVENAGKSTKEMVADTLQ
jgi:tetratricopeptide (TPR) repeat protein